ncbi:unnamed protein product [Anisakis simplex]|uniref:Lactamase_B domain-containing protein n=1 Tax=Anisakis simplex TaxID=6269 RepID=A0A0M3JZR9_ANISI|nr:unnamed protein product [Anisakis simplex]
MVTSLEDNNLALAILKMLGLVSQRSIEDPGAPTIIQLPTTPRMGVRVSERDVCPFGADPLLLSGEYSYCKPSLNGACPVGFICDQSFVLGRSICCQDLRSRPRGRGTDESSLYLNIRFKLFLATNSPSSAVDSTWNGTSAKGVNVDVIQSTESPRWTPFATITTRRTPWYIKDRIAILNPDANTTSMTTPSNYQSTTASFPATATAIPSQIELTGAKGTEGSSTKPFQVVSVFQPKHPETTTGEPTSSTSMPGADIIVEISSTTSEQPKKAEIVAIPVITSTKSLNHWARIWTTEATPHSAVNVSVLQSGSMHTLNGIQMESVATITLINDNGRLLLVDTGLAKESITLDEIDVVVITNGHPGYIGNLNLFGRKPILFHTLEYVGRHVSATELKDRPYRKLSTNVEVWKTPGQTQQDLSVLVYNVPGYGSMAIVGDLIPSEAFFNEKTDLMIDEGVWDAASKRQNANLMICMADWIIPGHGQPFRVLPQYRQKAGCHRILSKQRKVH